MAEPQEYFELPRKDWYDEKGRIYKDALIENFNAIEKKLLQLARLSAFITEAPDISSMEFEDVNLETSEDNKLVNLRSFLNIMNLVNYPLELTFSGKTCTKICYWSDEYKYVTITNKKISCSDALPYIYFNFNTKEFIATDSEETPEDSLFIACYADNKIIGLYSDNYVNINALYYLPNMSIETYDRTYDRVSRHSGENGRSTNMNGRYVGGYAVNYGTGTKNNITWLDIGRTSK